MIGGERQITSVVQPDYAIDQKLTWSSLDSTIVSVDQNGLLKGESHGIWGLSEISLHDKAGNFKNYSFLEVVTFQLVN